MVFDLDIEDDFNSYNGISINTLPDGTRHMSQPGLINNIIKTTNMQKCKPNKTPSAQIPLSSDPNGELYDQTEWNYASVIGMLLHVSNNTRPNITFAVSQAARFTSNPKQSHSTAVKTIICYLANTFAKGIYVKPNGTFNLNIYVDADFAGNYRR